MTYTTLLESGVECPECEGEAQIVRDTSGEIYEDGNIVLECLEKSCLHWEYTER